MSSPRLLAEIRCMLGIRDPAPEEPPGGITVPFEEDLERRPLARPKGGDQLVVVTHAWLGRTPM